LGPGKGPRLRFKVFGVSGERVSGFTGNLEKGSKAKKKKPPNFGGLGVLNPRGFKPQILGPFLGEVPPWGFLKNPGELFPRVWKNLPGFGERILGYGKTSIMGGSPITPPFNPWGKFLPP